MSDTTALAVAPEINAKRTPTRQNKKRAANAQSNPITKYRRLSGGVSLKGAKNSNVKKQYRKEEKFRRDAAAKAANAEILLTAQPGYLEAEGMEKTFKVKQEEIVDQVDLQSGKKIFNLLLDTYGPYAVDYTRNGRYLLIGGKLGHLAVTDWTRNKIVTEFQVKENVKDVKFLQDHTLFAVAQKKYVYIYDHSGVEVHCLKKHLSVNKLEFLPYHFLLVSVGEPGYLKFQDVSTGELVTEIRTKLGPCNVLTHNPYNAISLLGHLKGTVTMWTPNLQKPVVTMLCHKAPVLSVAVDITGNYMATSGIDGQVKLWDVRKYGQLDQFYTPTPASSVTFSQMGLLGVSYGSHIQIWKDITTSTQTAPYMTHQILKNIKGRRNIQKKNPHQAGSSAMINQMQFCPFEDILGVGHARGFSSVGVPGSGQPNFDSFEANPYISKSARREQLVHSLLEKIPAEMITLDPNVIGTVDKASAEVIKAEKEQEHNENDQDHPDSKSKGSSRTRRNARRRQRNKYKNIIDAKRLKLQEEKLNQTKEQQIAKSTPEIYSALNRFKK